MIQKISKKNPALSSDTESFIDLIFISELSMKGLDSLIGDGGCGSLNECGTAVKHTDSFIQSGRD